MKPRVPVSVDAMQVQALAETFRLLGDPTRLRIVLSCLAGPRSVGDIAATLQLTQTLVSHHLRLLRGARLVRGERQGRLVFYALTDRHVSDMLRDMAIHVAEDDGRTARAATTAAPRARSRAGA